MIERERDKAQREGGTGKEKHSAIEIERQRRMRGGGKGEEKERDGVREERKGKREV